MKTITLSIMFLMLAACGDKGFQAVSSTGNGAQQCLAKTSSKKKQLIPKFVNAYERSQQKVLFLNQKSSLTPDQTLPKNFPISVFVDRKCVSEKTNLSFLTKFLKKSPKLDFTKYSAKQAYTVKLPSKMTMANLQRVADQDLCVIGVSEEVFAEPTSAPNDERFPQQTHLTTLRYTEIHEPVFLSSKKLTGEYIVAVIDTGFLLNHPDLINRYWVNADEIPDNEIDDDNNGVVDDVHGSNQNGDVPYGNPSSANYSQHGTHVAGLSSAEAGNGIGVVGVMGYNTKVMAINAWPYLVGTGGGNAPMSVVDRSIRYAVDNGAKVINISMQGEGYFPAIEDALHYATERGVFVAIAAGNNAKQMVTEFIGSPAIYAKDIDGAVAVAAMDSKNGAMGGRCVFSNYSATHAEIAAPGCDTNSFTNYGGAGILSTITPSTEPSGYGWIQGTSMASPVAAGTAAYIHALLKEWTTHTPTAALIEKIMVDGSFVNPNLVGVTQQGRTVDLKSIHDHILQNYIPKPNDPPTNPPEECL